MKATDPDPEANSAHDGHPRQRGTTVTAQSGGIPTVCPACNARFPLAVICPRCKADLTPLVAVLVTAWRWRERGRRAFRRGRFRRAIRCWRQALRLQDDPLTHRRIAVARRCWELQKAA